MGGGIVSSDIDRFFFRRSSLRFRLGFLSQHSASSLPFSGLILGPEFGCELANRLAADDSVGALLIQFAADVDGQLCRAWKGEGVQRGLDFFGGYFVVWIHGG